MLKKNIFLLFKLFFTFSLLLHTVGCVTSEPIRFYTLTAIMPVQSAPEKEITDNITIGIGPVIIPDYIDRAQIVSRIDENQLDLAAHDYWAGSLKDNILRVLVDNISSAMTKDPVSILTWEVSAPLDYRVEVGITAFDILSDKKVILNAHITIVDNSSRSTKVTGKRRYVKKTEEEGYANAVKAMSQVLSDLSRDIAEDLQKRVR